ncbi:hypothetical protein ACWPKO_25670 (plasmid) [Coraliomargarita sp. W4R53]
MKKSTWARVSAGVIGASMLVGVAGAAMAEEQQGESDVDVTVSIAAIEEPGVLAMTIAGTETVLSEDGSDEMVRQFTGSLPTVSVTDTRDAAEIPEGAAWYVLGSSTDFVGDADQPDIGAGNLGWAPRLIQEGDSGLVAAGDTVDTVLDDGPDAVGLVDAELFAIAADSASIAEEGQWTATADLFLRTPATVAAGEYSATLTLSLFE